MKRFIMFIVAVGLLLMPYIPGNASAEMKPGAISISPFLGGYIFEGNQSINSDPVYGLGLGYNLTENWGVEGVYGFVDTDMKSVSRDTSVEASIFRLDGLYHFIIDDKLVPYLGAGLGAININKDPGDNDTNGLFNYGGGIKYFITEALAVRADVRHIIDFDDPNNNMMYTLGVTYMFGGKEKAAPAPAPRVAVAPVPEPAAVPVDSDGDGVYDENDKCPGTPAGVAVDANGCPKDSDGDGVPDYLDKCPNTPAGVAVDSNGCPKDSDSDSDSDSDGVYDENDKCPGTPAGVAVDANGCPKDSDGDGVPDYLDKCPDTLKGVAVDQDGCPIPVVIELDDIHFDFDKATLTDEAKNLLKKNLQSIKDNPGISVRIQGNSCAHGPEDYNMRLSERRANAVKEYLVNGGIAADRLSAISYGETRLAMPEIPTPKNKNSSEAKTNRRVHFEVLFQ